MKKRPLTEEKIQELQEFGNQIDVKVTPNEINGKPVVDILDVQFDDFIKAALYLQHLQREQEIRTPLHLVA